MSMSDFLAKAEKEFLYGGHLFAFGSAGVIFSTSIIGGFNADAGFLILIYFIYYLIYLYDHSVGADSDVITNPIRAEYLKDKIKKEKYIFILSCFIIGIILVLKRSLFIFIASILTLGLGVLYGRIFKNITKIIIAFKNFFVAAFWAIIVIYASLCHGFGVSSAVGLLSLFVFVRMLAVQIFFDIRDVEGDSMKKLRTIPVVWGKENAVKIIYILNIISIFVLLFAIGIGCWNSGLILLSLSLLYNIYYLKKYKKGDGTCYLWAAAEPIIWSFLVMLSNI